jgi:NADP-reducing hydrogenase subunit HndB
MGKLTFEELKQIKTKTAEAMAVRLGKAHATVTVHMGTCGIAAGARDVMKRVLEETAGCDRADIRVLAAGCLGKCATEPNVTVQLAGSDPVVYQKMDPAKMQQVFQHHVLSGEVQREFMLA